MQKQSVKRLSWLLKTRARAAVIASLLLLAVTAGCWQVGAHAATCYSSSDCQAKINNLQAANETNKAKQSSLAGRASSYRDTIRQLENQIATINQQISKNQAEQAKLKKQIIQKKHEVAHQKAVLRTILRTMYADGQITTIEMIATSKNLSDFVDRSQYQYATQNKVQDTLDTIAALQKQLQHKKKKVDGLIETEKTQERQVEADKAQQAQLLSYNLSQQAAYNAKISANKKNISSLYSRLAALNAGGSVNYSGTCGGGYPQTATNSYGTHWGCNYPQDNTIDNWNMLNRECVSYTAWMVYKNYGYSTSGWGNAANWIYEAESHGIPVSQTPHAGDIAIRARDYGVPGDVGHAMYVVSARSRYDVTVWEYNRNYDGTFDQRTFDPPVDYGPPVYYLHFSER